MFSEILNGKSLRRRRFHSRLFAIALSLIMIGKLSASVMRIDGGFEDWKDVKVCAYDPKGDAKGAFDITKVYAASQGSILYLRFDTTNLLNLQNGPEAEGTLLVIIDLPNNQELVLDMRGRRAFLNDSLKERIPWDRLKYIVGPTYAQNEFEIQVDLGGFNINCGDAIASKYPLKALPSKNDRYAAAYIGLAENHLFIINVHLSAMGYIGSEDDRLRILQVDDIVATIDEIHRGQYDEDDAPGTQPGIVIVGDFNLVGSRTPLDMIIDKKVYGLKDWLIPNLIGESVVTWRGGSHASFSPGKLDYIVYSTRTLIPKNGFILNSELLNRTERKQLSLDVADSKLSDHLLMTVDFQFSDSQEN